MANYNGFTKINNSILLDANISANAKVVYATLSFFDRGRGCWAKREFLSKKIGLSQHLLRKALLELQDNKLIHITKRHHGLTDIIRVHDIEARIARDANSIRDEADETLIKKIKEEKIEEELASKSKDINTTTKTKAVIELPLEDKSYKKAYLGMAATAELQKEQINMTAEVPIDDRGYKKKFTGVHNYRLYNKWIKKTAITNETETYVELTSSLNEKQKDFLREHYKETLERIFGKKIVLF